jgi:hypothetical protein
MIKRVRQLLVGRMVPIRSGCARRCHEVRLVELLLSLGQDGLDAFRRRDNISLVLNPCADRVAMESVDGQVRHARAMRFMRRDITHAAERVAQLELEVNSRAGEKLLVWENEWGGHKTGFWGPRPARGE